MSDETIDLSRRKFLGAATTVVGGVGLACLATPFVKSLLPSARAQALGAPVDVNLKPLALGAQLTVSWRGQPIWVVRRSPQMLEELKAASVTHLRDPDSEVAQQPVYAQNWHRSVYPEYLVLVGICTHLGCVPTFRPDHNGIEEGWPGGFYCPCHGSKYDLAGRVYKGVPAPTNLVVPPHRFENETVLIVGEEEGTTA